uniref:uncharacterized protein LOC122593921 n=1 Tax=Erigeron canadensis TaxID=72917 RepID=UPI001CB91CD0|nr:uncharacterized protein LOC122593921 [Erigeron canadensis]
MRSMKKSPKVADESKLEEENGVEFPTMGQHTRPGFSSGLSLIYRVIRAPLSSLVSCISFDRRISGATDRVWVSGEPSRMSEANHLMVIDSMRYAILM